MRTIGCVLIAILLGLAAVSAHGADLGKGIEAYRRGDYEAALRHWRPLAGQGNAAAQVMLGVMYYKVEGVPEDIVQAYPWSNLAAAGGREQAKKLKRLL